MHDRFSAESLKQPTRPRLFLVAGTTGQADAKGLSKPSTLSPKTFLGSPSDLASESPGLSVASAERSWMQTVTAVFQKFEERRRRKVAMHELRALNRHMQRDIGIEPGTLWHGEMLILQLRLMACFVV